MTDPKVYILDHGRMMLKEHFLYWNSLETSIIPLPVYSVLIDHADGLFLFDSGFDHAHMETVLPGMSSQSEAQTLHGQLRLIGRDPDEIDIVVNSHFHFDHVGGNKHCRHAKTVCHACELEEARAPEAFEAVGYSDLSFAPGLRDDEPDVFTPRFETLRGDQEIASGLHLFETPGHTFGHYSLMVRMAGRRPMLFTGDAAYSARTMARRQIASAHVDPIASFRSLDRLDALAEQHEAELFYSHDIEQFGKYKVAPNFYS